MRALTVFLLCLFTGLSYGQTLPENDPHRQDTFIMVDKMPEFPGGQDSLLAFISSHLQYPEKARKRGIEGKVMVGFVVDKSGKVRDEEVKRSVDPLLDNEALRVIRLMPDWVPGIQSDKAVNVSFVLPLAFRLDK